VTVGRLGEILLERGWITRADLARALKSQQLVGGRLGTCLLEGESLSEELLARALSEQLGVDAAPIEDVRHADPEALALLPKRLAVRCRAIPMRATVSRLELATADPGNLGCQDEIAFATSRRVVVKVAGEARIVEALHRYYGEPAPGRFVGLVDRLNRQRSPWQDAVSTGGAAAGDVLGPIGDGAGRTPATAEEETTAGESASAGGPAVERAAAGRPGAPPSAAVSAGGPAAAPHAAPPPAPAAEATAATASPPPVEAAVPAADGADLAPRPAARRPQRQGAVTLSPSERAALLGAGGGAAGPPAGTSTEPAVAPAAAPAPAPLRREPTTFAVAAALLDEAAERDEIGRILLTFLRQFFDRVVLLAVRGDGVRGWLGAGDGVDRERLDDLAIPFDRASVFLNLRQGSPLHLGPLPPMPAHRPLLAALGGGDPPGPCLLLPVRLGGRLAAVIYGDREGAPVSGIDLDGLRRLAERASIALERCISLKRKAHSGPAAG
jgi:hypothetical protein